MKKMKIAVAKRHCTKEEKAYHDRLCSIVGCIICLLSGIKNHHCSIHHCHGRTKPNAQWFVLPLCGAHHQTGGRGVAFHAGKAIWEKKFGTQKFLKQLCDAILAKYDRGEFIS